MGWGTVINCFYIPGAFIGGLLSDRIGRRRTMALGFGLQAILGFVLGGALKGIQPILSVFIIMYGVFLTLGEVGPGATIVLASSESFPTSIRGQCLGLIAAFVSPASRRRFSYFSPEGSSQRIISCSESRKNSEQYFPHFLPQRSKLIPRS